MNDQETAKWYGKDDVPEDDDFVQISKRVKNNNLIYCPLIKDWINRNDCEPCEMCDT